MSSASRRLVGALALGAAIGGAVIAVREGLGARVPDREPGAMGERESVLRVCADPNNLPFSNAAGEGFENELAALVATDMGRSVRYRWWPQRRGFIRSTLAAGTCDVVMGVPREFELASTTRPYYRSSYVFVWRPDRVQAISSFDDARLHRLRVGVHLVGDDYANVPPAQALARRGIIQNVRGYTIYGDYSRPNPPADLIAAAARGDVDVAIAWGPLAGYFARRTGVPLALAPVTPEREGPLTFAFDISMGVRRDDTALRARLDDFIVRRRADIRRVLGAYGVPLAEDPLTPEEAGTP